MAFKEKSQIIAKNCKQVFPMECRRKITLKSLFLILLCVVLSACNGSSTKYDEALSLMESGDYQAAIDIFTAIPDYENSSDKIVECKYMLGTGAIENENWVEAIDYFTGLDYKDSTDLLEQCVKEKGMHENADYSFLEDLERAVLDRMETVLTENYDNASAVNTELAYIEKYENKTFYDSALKAICDRYIDGLHIQRDALRKVYNSQIQIEWQRGLVDRYEALRDLYDEYGFLEDNHDFVGNYILQCDDQRALLDAYDAIELDISSQTNADDFMWSVTDAGISCTIKNNTKYQYSTIYEMSFIDENGVIFETNSDYIENIFPGNSYVVSIYVSDPSRVYDAQWSNYYTDVKY